MLGRWLAGRLGSIPASAGEPPPSRAGRRADRVYPRECGGTQTKHRPCLDARGLSPRVRGNPPPPRRTARPAGSIPASAGEPRRSRAWNWSRRVYPRECGGTRLPAALTELPNGLSPRVRGNRHVEVGRLLAPRSIPASAGEPPTRSPISPTERVYPRECGGTVGGERGAVDVGGLSPRVRGNPSTARASTGRARSIPASAGEPTLGKRRAILLRVYPRECGGTGDLALESQELAGLSPRVRGNRSGRAGEPLRRGSIPASAGEPEQAAHDGHVLGVYPRECGGTVRKAMGPCSCAGLSPRVRGNPDRTPAEEASTGSIPASAGEPPCVRPRR